MVMGVAALLVPACAATVAPESGAASDDDSGEGGGGAGGAAEPPPNPCGIDCSDIVTPSCYRSKCDKMTEQCVVVPDDGADCDDGVFCTVGDRCHDSRYVRSGSTMSAMAPSSVITMSMTTS